ncbi:hypothetical protein DSO57_1020729 [Entomophthora muscae]|uniref:Uncharacterized protein n=1 Tax=Entomophthora muscae TaxID=34485 RepID=A0ACC2UQ97_9FUNG|nr:hypothetical protein DSO57_1020729 [Entomophthora muscae]
MNPTKAEQTAANAKAETSPGSLPTPVVLGLRTHPKENNRPQTPEKSPQGFPGSSARRERSTQNTWAFSPPELL